MLLTKSMLGNIKALTKRIINITNRFDYKETLNNQGISGILCLNFKHKKLSLINYDI